METDDISGQLGIPSEAWQAMSPSEKLARFRSLVAPPKKRGGVGYRPSPEEQAELERIVSPIERLQRFRELAAQAE